jgi:hypothetical protein
VPISPRDAALARVPIRSVNGFLQARFGPDTGLGSEPDVDLKAEGGKGESIGARQASLANLRPRQMAMLITAGLLCARCRYRHPG